MFLFEPPAIFVPRELPMKHRIIKEAYQLIAALVTSYTGQSHSTNLTFNRAGKCRQAVFGEYLMDINHVYNNYHLYSLIFVLKKKNQFSGAFAILIFYRLLAYTCLVYYLSVSIYFMVFLGMQQQQKQNFPLFYYYSCKICIPFLYI